MGKAPKTPANILPTPSDRTPAVIGFSSALIPETSVMALRHPTVPMIVTKYAGIKGNKTCKLKVIP